MSFQTHLETEFKKSNFLKIKDEDMKAVLRGYLQSVTHTHLY